MFFFGKIKLRTNMKIIHLYNMNFTLNKEPSYMKYKVYRD